MARVDITIRNNVHMLACDDGQESRLQILAAALSKRVDGLSHNFAKANDITLVIMAALMLEDEIMEIHKQQKQLSLNIPQGPVLSKDNKSSDAAIIDAIQTIRLHVENLANKIEKV